MIGIFSVGFFKALILIFKHVSVGVNIHRQIFESCPRGCRRKIIRKFVHVGIVMHVNARKQRNGDRIHDTLSRSNRERILTPTEQFVTAVVTVNAENRQILRRKNSHVPDVIKLTAQRIIPVNVAYVAVLGTIDKRKFVPERLFGAGHKREMSALLLVYDGFFTRGKVEIFSDDVKRKFLFSDCKNNNR